GQPSGAVDVAAAAVSVDPVPPLEREAARTLRASAELVGDDSAAARHSSRQRSGPEGYELVQWARTLGHSARDSKDRCPSREHSHRHTGLHQTQTGSARSNARAPVSWRFRRPRLNRTSCQVGTRLKSYWTALPLRLRGARSALTEACGLLAVESGRVIT